MLSEHDSMALAVIRGKLRFGKPKVKLSPPTQSASGLPPFADAVDTRF